MKKSTIFNCLLFLCVMQNNVYVQALSPTEVMLILLLLERPSLKPNPSIGSRLKNGALRFAIKRHLPIEQLLKWGADPYHCNNVLFSYDDPRYRYPLLLAVACNNVSAMKTLFAAGLTPDKFRGFSRCHDDEDPLCVAAFFGHLDAVRALIQAGALVNKGWGSLETPFVYAAMGGQIEMMKFLIKEQKELCTPYYGLKAMREAARCGQHEVIEFLVACGCRPHGVVNAAKAKRFDTVKLLVKLGCSIDEEQWPSSERDEETALKYAVKQQDLVFVEGILKLGANPNDRGTLCCKNVALCVAFDTRQVEMVRILLEHGADLKLLPYSPFYMALDNGFNESDMMKMIPLLVNYGAEIEDKTLYDMIYRGGYHRPMSLSMVKEMINLGAQMSDERISDIEHIGNDLRGEDHESIVKYLKEHARSRERCR